MVLALYRRHRRDCKASISINRAPANMTAVSQTRRRGWFNDVPTPTIARDETSIKTRRPAVVSCTASLKVEADAIRILKTIASTRIG
jgi:hypothetical protein